MCLDFVDEKMKACKVGWKVMQQTLGGGLCSVYASAKSTPTGVWLNEYDYRDEFEEGSDNYIETTHDIRYPRGWHSYNHKRDALFRLKMLIRECLTKLKNKRYHLRRL